MSEERIITIAISSGCALIGAAIFLAAFKRRGHWLKIIGLAFLLVGIVSLFVNDANFRQILTAAAGVIAATAATVALQQNLQLRKDAKDRELRNRYELLLNEIIDWAKSILTVGLEPGKQADFELRPENVQLFKNYLLQHNTDLRRLNRDGIYLKHIILTDWKGLDSKIKQVRREIGKLVGLIDKYIDNIRDKAIFEEANTHRSKMNEIAETIIKEAANIKIELFKVKS